MRDKIKITLKDGRKYTLRSSEELDEIDMDKTAIFVFDNGQIYEGKSDGEIDTDDDDEEVFYITKDTEKIGLGLPYNRLVGWAYKEESEETK